MNMTVAAICSIVLLLFAGLMIISYCFSVDRTMPKMQKESIICFVVLAVLGFLLCRYILSKNEFVYYWDYGGYWSYSFNTMYRLFSDPIGELNNIYTTICQDEYNLLLPLIIAMPLSIFGYEFHQYVLINYCLFLLPAWFIIFTICRKLIYRIKREDTTDKEQNYSYFEVLFLIFGFIPFYRAMLYGFIDVACLIPASMAILLYTEYKPLQIKTRQIIKDILIGLLLLVAFLFRRYFVFYGLAYASMLTALSCYEALKQDRGSRIVALRNALINLLVVAAALWIPLLLFFRQLVVMVINNHYAEQYAGYDASLISKISSLGSSFGWFLIVIMLIGIIASIVFDKLKKEAIFFTGMILITVCFFFRIQVMGDHHIYTIAVPVFLLVFIGYIHIWRFIGEKHIILRGTISSMIALTAIMYCFLLSPGTFDASAMLFPKRYTPLVRSDIPELYNLEDYLQKRSLSIGAPVYIAASGNALNISVMDSLHKPYEGSHIDYLLWTNDVDLRDGFPEQFLYAGIVVTSDPIQLHLAEGTQEVVRFLAEEVSDEESPIGRHFVRDERSFHLDGNVNVYVYEKKSDFEQSDLEYMREYFSKLYPGYESVFADRIHK